MDQNAADQSGTMAPAASCGSADGAIRIGGEFEVEKFLRVASDIGEYVPGTDPRYQPDGRAGTPDDIERLNWVARWLGLKDPRRPKSCSVSASPCTRHPVSRGSICWPSWRQSAKGSRWIGISGPGTIRSETGNFPACLQKPRTHRRQDHGHEYVRLPGD